MPAIPLYNEQQVREAPLPGVRVAQPLDNPFGNVGKGLEGLGEQAFKIVHGAEIAESRKLIGEGTEGLLGAIQDAKIKFENPEEYRLNALERLKEVNDSILEKASSSRSRQIVESYLAEKMAAAKRHVDLGYFEKKKDRARADTDSALDQLARTAIADGSEENMRGVARMGGDLLGRMKSDNFYSAQEVTNLGQAFEKKIRDGRKEVFFVGLKQDLGTIINDATTGKASPNDLFAKGTAMIDKFGDMDPAEVAKTKAWFKDALWTGAIEGGIARDPVGTNKKLEAGDFNSFVDQQSLRFLKNKSEAELERIRRAMEADRQENERRIGKEVDDFKAATMANFEWAGNVRSLAERVRGTEHEREFLETMRDSHELSMFALKGPADQEAELRYRVSGAKTGSEAQLYAKMETAHRSAKAALKDDPLTYAIRQRAIPPLNPLNLNNPASLRERSIAASLVEQRYGVPASPLSDEEATALSDQLSKSPADQQLQILTSLRRGLDDRYVKAVAGQLAKKKNDPVLAQAMGLSTENPEAAARILRGREIMRDNKEVMPKGADLKSAQDRIASTLAEAYQHNPEHYSAVSDAAMAIYAFKNWQAKKLTGEYDADRMNEAIKEATGGVLQLGTIGSRYKVQPPRYGMDEAGFMDSLKRADYSKAKGMTGADIQKHGVFESIGDGKYLVKLGPGYVMSDNGPFILDLGSILSGAQRGAAIGGAAGYLR